MARCIHEVMVPVYDRFSNPFSDGTAMNIAELRCVCGCLASTYHGVECTGSHGPQLKIRCFHYKPESVVNRMPNEAEDRHEPPPV